MAEACLFCKIAQKELAADIILETDTCIVFRDIAPQAPEHLLTIPKKHIHNIDAVRDEDAMLLSDILIASKKAAAMQQMSQSGYRLVINCNDDGGQSVDHLHCHLLGKRKMNWPPG